MASTVTINVTARDLTRAQLARLRHNFNSLGQDMDRAIGNRTRNNFDRLRQSVTQTRRDLNSLRGTIPDDEFMRLDNAIRRAQRTMRRGFGRMNDASWNRLNAQIRRVHDGFRDLDRTGRIRVRVDTSALRRADARLDAWRRMQGRRSVRVRVDPDVNRHRFRRMLLGGLTAPFRAAGGTLGGIFSDGIGQGIADGVKAGGPIFGALLVAVIAGLAGVVGAALSGLLITAFGLAFVSIGGVSAAMSKKVQDQWQKTLKSLKRDFAEVGEPMIPVLDKALRKLQRMSHEFAPKLKESIDEAAPITDRFITQIMDSFKTFGKAAFDPIMRAWEIFAPVFGEEWDNFMGNLGRAFGDMAKLVSEHPTEIAAALRIVFDTLVLLVDTVTWFGRMWVAAYRNAGDAVGWLYKMVAKFVDFSLASFDFLLSGAEVLAAAFGARGIAGKLRTAREAFGAFREQVKSDLLAASDSAYSWGQEIDKANRRRTLDADISIWTHKLEVARADLKKTTNKKAVAKLDAEIRELQRKIKQARGELDAINGKIVYTYVKTVHTDSFPAQHGGISRAMGGIVGRAATGGIRSNMTMVGEHGPELVALPAGSHVRSAPDTSRMLTTGGGGGGGPMQINVMIDGRVAARALIDPLRGEIRDKGGNVQNALGQRGK